MRRGLISAAFIVGGLFLANFSVGTAEQDKEPAPKKPERPEVFDLTRDKNSFRRLVRTAIFGFLRDFDAAEESMGRTAVPDRSAPESYLESKPL